VSALNLREMIGMVKRYNRILDNDLRIALMNLRTLMAMRKNDEYLKAELKAMYSHLMFHGILVESMEKGIDVINALLIHSAYMVDYVRTIKSDKLSGEMLELFEVVKKRTIAISQTESEIYNEVVGV